MAQAVDIQKVFAVSIFDMAMTVGLATAIDNAFPEAKELESKSLWQVILEAAGQTIINVLLLLELRNHIPSIYSEDPTGGFIPNGLLFQIQPNLLKKYIFLSRKLVQYATSVFPPASQPAPPPPSQ